MSPDDPRHGTNAGYAQGCRQPCCQRAHRIHVTLWRLGRLDRLVPAIGTHRRIEALMTLGWSRAYLSRQLGKRPEYLKDLRDRTVVRTSTRDAIVALYDRLSMQVAPYSPASQKARAYAKRCGYLPPLMWEDGLIDDPMHNPIAMNEQARHSHDVDEAVVVRVLSGERLSTNIAEREEILRRWVASGGSLNDMCGRMGWRKGRHFRKGVGASAHGQEDERRAS